MFLFNNLHSAHALILLMSFVFILMMFVKQPYIPTENNMLMLQETCTDTMGSLVVYAPMDIPAINIAMNGEDSSEVPILPSGFIISGDGRPETGTIDASTSANAGGSLLTVAFQILVSSPSSLKQLNVESVATVNTLISSTVQRIKASLNCSGLDWTNVEVQLLVLYLQTIWFFIFAASFSTLVWK